jgi:hypothetical protein
VPVPAHAPVAVPVPVPVPVPVVVIGWRAAGVVRVVRVAVSVPAAVPRAASA